MVKNHIVHCVYARGGEGEGMGKKLPILIIIYVQPICPTNLAKLGIYI